MKEIAVRRHGKNSLTVWRHVKSSTTEGCGDSTTAEKRGVSREVMCQEV